jgi:hypothetical protein
MTRGNFAKFIFISIFSKPLFCHRCPLPGGVISKFKYNENLGVADATLYSMFRFQDSNEIHFQCDLAVCKGACPEPKCDGQSKALTDEAAEQSGGLLASTNVYVLEPGQPSSKYYL